MAYTNMDHAGWLQGTISAAKKSKPTAKERRALADHKGWHAAPDVLNPFQRRAADLLGIVGNGIYSAPIAWSGVIWAPNFIIVPWWKGLGTFDFMELTRFVFLCHDARIRGYISTHSPRHLEIALHERVHEGPMSLRHPNLDEAVAAWRAEVPLDHPIAYRVPDKAEQAA